MSVLAPSSLLSLMLTIHSIRELQMASRPDHLPRRYIRPYLPSNPLPSFRRRYDLGRHLERSDGYIILPGGSDDHQKVQDHVCLVSCHDNHDDCLCRRGPYRQTRTVRLANYGICHDLATGKHRQLPLSLAVSAQSRAHAVHVLALLLSTSLLPVHREARKPASRDHALK